MKIVVAGGSGALGRRLCDDLAARGHDVVVLTRNPGSGPHRQVKWDGVTVGAWAQELTGSAVVNLAGELVDRRPTATNIELLTTSRVNPTRALAAAVGQLGQSVPVWIQASTLAIYGDAGEQLLTEQSPLADSPPQMAGVACAWEAAAANVPAERQVVLRTSIVLDRGSPALQRLTQLVRLGLGGRIGNGRQWISWLHIDDWLEIARYSLFGGEAGGVSSGKQPHGVLLATAPNPVRNVELMHTMRRVLHRPPAPPTPVPLVKLGATLLRTDPALALTGRRAVPARLLNDGFSFRYPQLAEAVTNLLDR